ncbi:hypothetical protein PaecuDRAFT_4223 [Paenibacillus curdlanolyticus YK9]|uniref:Uncharacterized protein n=1 Tax=Paenibacillus curdlanolyticus YK9 TaxID=717606 RepID=E0IEY2_9BACL|nr:hypothetical protein [Paenibacillus curdlanolyticus]EFM08758.1 hypothetical protein PaecuDRAFT_4223 [Paenibacillus curdlanolyticus YK9]
MPPYYSIHFSFPYSSYSPTFVEDIYTIIFKYFPFKSGYWHAEHDSFEEIVKWNDRLLSKKFILGYDQHYTHDYKQLLLDSAMHHELRLFWMYGANEITLHFITSEDDVLLAYPPLRFDLSKLQPFINLSVDLWTSQPASVVQTYLELGEPVRLRKLNKGAQPSIEPFCMMGRELFNKMKSSLPANYVSKLHNRGVLVVDQDYLGSFNHN